VTLSLLDRPDDAPPAGRPDGAGGAAGRPDPIPGSASEPSAGHPAKAAPPGFRVLVVDDTSSIRTEIRLLLEDAGLAVVGEGSHGAEGVMLARELRPDVVVMDVRMPILDGIAATSYITRELPDTRVIVFSAFDDEELAEAARAAGAAGFLTKGASPADIAAAVQDAAR
jgi:DNA-binding NarL/FixJ family response regulator